MKVFIFLISLISLPAFASSYECSGQADFGRHYNALVHLDINYAEKRIYLENIKLTSSAFPKVNLRENGELLISYLEGELFNYRGNSSLAFFKEGKRVKTFRFSDQSITWSRMFFSIIKNTNHAHLVYELNSRVQRLLCKKK